MFGFAPFPFWHGTSHLHQTPLASSIYTPSSTMVRSRGTTTSRSNSTSAKKASSRSPPNGGRKVVDLTSFGFSRGALVPTGNAATRKRLSSSDTNNAILAPSSRSRVVVDVDIGGSPSRGDDIDDGDGIIVVDVPPSPPPPPAASSSSSAEEDATTNPSPSKRRRSGVGVHLPPLPPPPKTTTTAAARGPMTTLSGMADACVDAILSYGGTWDDRGSHTFEEGVTK